MTAAVDEELRADQLPELLRFAAVLTGTAPDAERLAGEGLARVADAERRASPRRAAQRAVVERFLARSFGYLPRGALGRLDRATLVVLALTEVDHLGPAEIAATLDRPAAWVTQRLADARTAGDLADELADELAERQCLTPDPVRLHEHERLARRRAGRHRRRVLVGTLAAVLAVVVAVLAPAQIRARWPVDPRPAGQWVSYARLVPGSDWAVIGRTETPRQETVTFSRADATNADLRRCTVSLTDGDRLAPATSVERRVRVNGHRGVVRDDPTGPAVRWAYAADAVAELHCNDAGTDRETLLGLAADLRFHGAPVLIPYRLPEPPGPYRPVQVTVDPTYPGTVTVHYADPGASGVTLRITADHGAVAQPGPTGATRLPAGVTYTWGYGRDTYLRPDRDHTGLPEICLAERTGQICLTAEWTSDRASRPTGTDVGALLTATAAGLQFAADQFDQRTWYDAEQVLR